MTIIIIIKTKEHLPCGIPTANGPMEGEDGQGDGQSESRNGAWGSANEEWRKGTGRAGIFKHFLP